MQPIRRTVAVLSSTVLLVMIGVSIILPALPQYGLAIGATAFLAGVLVGALPAARLLLNLPAGAWADRFGNDRIMRIGLAIIALSSALAVVAFNYWVLLSVRIAEGIGSAFYLTSSLGALARAVPSERRGRYMGVYVNALLFGQVLGPVIGGAVVLAWGLRAPFAAYALLACLGMMLVTFGLEPSTLVHAGGAVDFAGIRRLLSDRSYLLVNMGVMGAFFTRWGLIAAVVPLFVAFNWGVSSALATTYAGILITSSALASLLTIYPSGWIADRVGRKIPFVLSLVAAGFVVPFLFFTRDLAGAIPVMFLFGLVLGFQGPFAAWPTDLTPTELMGTSMGLYRMIADIGFLSGPVVLAAVLEFTMVEGKATIAAFLVAAVWVIASGLLTLSARDPVAEQRRAGAATGRPGNAN